MDIEEIRRADLRRILEAGKEEFKFNEKGYAYCPFCNSNRPKLGVFQKEDKSWEWHCFACGQKGDVIDFMEKRFGKQLKAIIKKCTKYKTAREYIIAFLTEYIKKDKKFFFPEKHKKKLDGRIEEKEEHRSIAQHASSKGLDLGMKKGYVRLWRKIMEHPFYKEKRKFSRYEALIDLIMLANGKNKQAIFRGEIIKVKRGQFITSELELSKRWGWSRDKVRRFLASTQKMGTIRNDKQDKRYTIITILNYERYNSLSESNKTRGKTTEKQQTRQQKNNRQDITNKDKERINNIYPPLFEKFWESYPRKVEKKNAYLTWEKLTKRQQKEVVIASSNYAEAMRKEQRELKHIKHPKTFLNPAKEVWKDYLVSKEKKELEEFEKRQMEALNDRA